MKLLLINPKYPESFWSFRWAVQEILPGKRAINPPLGLATVAALSPSHWQIKIIDENIEGIPLQPDADLIGICGMGVQYARQRELLSYYRDQGYFVVAGGSYASLCPDLYQDCADTVVSGEAEHAWPAFCADFERGTPLPLYREEGSVELADSPTPRFDLLRLDQYTTATMQFSRGCPYRCEFCDIIVMFGRKPRCKTVQQIERELDSLRSHGARNVFFVDDNLIGNRPLAKQLLQFLVEYQQRHNYALHFGTEASLNLARDAELLALFRQAGFTWVFIGIESPDAENLKQAKKTQNVSEDMLVSLRRIYAHGIDVLGGFIVGFDNDDATTFERQRQFITESGIQAAMVGLLTALPRTPLYERLQQEGRLAETREHSDNTKLATNVVPKRMSYETLIDGYQTLYQQLFSDRGIAARIRNKARYLRQPAYRSEYSARQQVGIVARLLWRGVLRGGWSRLYHFARTLPLHRPGNIPLVVLDWISGLAMRSYIERHFVTGSDTAAVERVVGTMRISMARYFAAGGAALAQRSLPNGVSHLALSLLDTLDQRFFSCAKRHLLRLLRRTDARITLSVETLHETQAPQMQALLSRLKGYGQRISIEIGARAQHLVHVDSSVFNLILTRPLALPLATRLSAN